ncbi:MAG: DUF1194 domain-containing protein [Alphaproteobacteria bacterium]|nr:DUF1194 domain-containing protein [Alphaproteobacteria bacterium]
MAQGRVPVDLALVLAFDASGSIDAEEFRRQKEGIAEAITDPRILNALRSGAAQRIAVAYVEWGGPGSARTVVGWRVIGDTAAASAFGAEVLAAPRSFQSFNAIGDAIDHGVRLFASCECEPARRVIDISADNRDMRSLRPAPLARDEAEAQGITINALAILDEDRPTGHDRSWLVEYLERDVIGGDGAFVIAARLRRDFTLALRNKLVREIAGQRETPRHAAMQALPEGTGTREAANAGHPPPMARR